MSINFQLGSLYSFDIYPTPVIGSAFKNVTVESVMLEAQARASGMETAVEHAKVYPYLPAGTPDDPAGYNYVKIRTLTGQSTILGLAWIKENTVQLIDARTATVKVGNITANDVVKIKNLLAQAGYNEVEITLS